MCDRVYAEVFIIQNDLLYAYSYKALKHSDVASVNGCRRPLEAQLTLTLTLTIAPERL
jgi:hypothetical protein